MKLKEIFDQLTYGELAHLAIGGGEAGSIQPANYPKVVSHINLGLTALYKRFNLKEGRVLLTLNPAIATYQINSKYALSTGSTGTRYITDSKAVPFKNDINKIERVYVSGGTELPMNDVDDAYSILTPTMTSLKVPNTILIQTPDTPDEFKTTTLSVVYRARHAPLEMEDIDPEDVEVELPDTHLEPLLYFVASRVHQPVGQMQTEGNMGNAYFAKYENACQQLELAGLQIDRQAQPDRITRGGWV